MLSLAEPAIGAVETERVRVARAGLLPVGTGGWLAEIAAARVPPRAGMDVEDVVRGGGGTRQDRCRSVALAQHRRLGGGAGDRQRRVLLGRDLGLVGQDGVDPSCAVVDWRRSGSRARAGAEQAGQRKGRYRKSRDPPSQQRSRCHVTASISSGDDDRRPSSPPEFRSLRHFSVSIRKVMRSAISSGRLSGSLTPWPPSSSSR